MRRAGLDADCLFFFNEIRRDCQRLFVSIFSEDGLDNLVTSRLGEKQVKGRTQPAILYEVNPYTVPLHEPKPKPQPQRRKTSPFASGYSSRTGMTDPLSNLPPWVTGKK